ncbi:MAG: hypothetical protein ACRDXX_04240 [Stackebrandtia sp.]
MSEVQVDRVWLQAFVDWCERETRGHAEWSPQVLADYTGAADAAPGRSFGGVKVPVGVDGARSHSGVRAGEIFAERAAECAQAHVTVFEALNALGEIARLALAEMGEVDAISAQRLDELTRELYPGSSAEADG